MLKTRTQRQYLAFFLAFKPKKVYNYLVQKLLATTGGRDHAETLVVVHVSVFSCSLRSSYNHR